MVLIAALSLSTCLKSKTSVDYSEFKQILEYSTEADGITSEKIDKIVSTNGSSVIKSNLSNKTYTTFQLCEVVFKNYNIDFSIKINGSIVKSFTTNYSRSADVVATLEEVLAKPACLILIPTPTRDLYGRRLCRYSVTFSSR